MAVEAKRGCGYRKVGGLYLVSGGAGVPCDRLPIRLEVCPVCSQGIKQSRGWTWIDLEKLLGGEHLDCQDRFRPCPVCDPQNIGKAGLLWIGEQFYKTPAEFSQESIRLGVSRRISAVPRNFEVGKTFVLLAHPKCFSEPVPEENQKTRWVPGIFKVWLPSRIEKICKESERGTEEIADLEKRGITPVFVPDDDKDHMGRVYDKDTADEEETVTV